MPINSPVSFSHPLFLVLLALLPGLYWLAHRRKGRRVPRGPWPVALWSRVILALLVILALSGLRVPSPARSVATVFVLDQSDSVPADIREGAKNWVREAMSKAGPDDLSGIVTFGKDAHIEQPLGKEHDHLTWSEPPAGNATDVGSALQLAADLLPPPGAGSLRRIVLLSDGDETRGDAQRALLRPQLRDVEVAVLALPQRLQDTAITSFEVPATLREGEPAELRVAIASPVNQQGTLRVWANDHLVSEQTVQLENGPTELVVSTGNLPKGFWSFHAQLVVDNDSRPENNESWAYSVVRDPARVLVVEGSDAPEVRQALAAAAVQVDRVSPADLPADPDQLAAYDSVILVNVNADTLGNDRMVALQRDVAERGKGLVVTGGDQTFGLGNYTGTPLEATLPVTTMPPERDQVASLALVLVIDRSGSMSTTDTLDRRATRLDLAKEGAIQAVETLKEGDQVGVIAFDSDAKWVTDVRSITGPADVQAIADRVSTIESGGGTDFFPPLELAYKSLQQVQARVKHVVLLTDGDDPSANRLPPLITAMRRAGITISTVGVSYEAGTAVLDRIARQGQGRTYFTNSPNDVPRMMTQEARLAGRNFKEEHDFQPRLTTAAPAVRGLVPSAFPPLHGYVRVSARNGAEIVLSSDQAEPVLAEWQYGLGRALVWTPDAQGDWSRDWVGTDQYRQLWSQAVRWTMPAAANPDLLVSITGDGERATVRADSFAPDGAFRNLLPTFADVSLPDGSGKRIPLQQTAPGRYEGQVQLAGAGVYPVQVTQTDDAGGAVAVETAGYALPYLPEYAPTAANRALLERLAADTGGPTLNLPAEAWRRDTKHALQPQEVWTYLLGAALVLWVLDAGVRRLRPTGRDVRIVGVAARRVGEAIRARGWHRPRLVLHPLLSGRRR